MISIYIYSFFSSIYFCCAGYILDPKNTDKNFYQSIIFGSILLSFLALFFNFFIPLSPTFNTFILLIILIIGFTCIYKNKKILKSFYYCFLVSIISTLVLTLDTINRPDASLYHLPYTKIINDSKIIFGISNLHFRFGHTSILQYTNALFNNNIFKENGILLPAAIIFSSIILFIYTELKKSFFKNKTYTAYLFLVLIYILYKYNRYSEFGNDVIAHLILITTTVYFLKINFDVSTNQKEFSKVISLSLFCFMLKPTVILVLLLPLYCSYFYFNFNYKNLIQFSNFLMFFFITIWVLKNIIISGCFIYPIELTCFDSLPWFSNDNAFAIAPSIQSLDNEAWTKGWPDYVGDRITQEFYVKDFFWVKTWLFGHGLQILQKLSIFLIFILVFLIFFMRIKIIKDKIQESKMKHSDKKLWFLFFLSMLGILLWFIRFPAFRYGSSYIVIFICITTTLILVKNKIEFKDGVILKKYINIFLIFVFFLFVSKHLLRINKNINLTYLNYPWPKFISEEQNDNDFKSDPIFINDVLEYYIVRSDDGCGYSLSPCTPFNAKKIKVAFKNSYKFYNLEK